MSRPPIGITYGGRGIDHCTFLPSFPSSNLPTYLPTSPRTFLLTLFPCFLPSLLVIIIHFFLPFYFLILYLPIITEFPVSSSPHNPLFLLILYTLFSLTYIFTIFAVYFYSSALYFSPSISRRSNLLQLHLSVSLSLSRCISLTSILLYFAIDVVIF